MTKTYTNTDIYEIAAIIRNAAEWDYDLLAILCAAADLSTEFDNADTDEVEEIAFQAADILGVEIL